MESDESMSGGRDALDRARMARVARGRAATPAGRANARRRGVLPTVQAGKATVTIENARLRAALADAALDHAPVTRLADLVARLSEWETTDHDAARG